MRIAFNLESLDLPPKARTPLNVRAEMLRPALKRLQADVLNLRGLNDQNTAGQSARRLLALDRLPSWTPYTNYARLTTTGRAGRGIADVHNLVTLSRFSICTHREVCHHVIAPPSYRSKTAVPAEAEARSIRFDRPFPVTQIEPPGGYLFMVINVHVAASVPGQRLERFVWKAVGGWAERYFLSAMRDADQTVELQFLLGELFDTNGSGLIAVSGDFNADDHEVPITLAVRAEENTGNPLLAKRSLIVLDRAMPSDHRWSGLDHGQRQMLDHILASPALHGRFIEIHDEGLSDELVGYA